MPGTSKLKFNRLSDLAAAGQLKGKRVFIRADLNVPQDEAGNITEDTRIRASIPAIKVALEAGAAVMVTSHLGRPTEGEFKPEDTLAPVADRIAELMERKVPLISHWVDGGFELEPGDLVLLENCRLNKGEKKNNEELAQKMAKLCDVYVNDAFGTAHRAHASTTIIAQFFKEAKCFGYLLAKEIESIEKVLKNSEKPVVAILGGSKVSSKITVIENILDKVNHMIIGGGMTFTFVKALGGKIGNSICEDDKLDLAIEILKQAKEKGVQIHIPVDVVAADAFSNDANTQIVDVNHIPDGWQGLDAGPKSLAIFRRIILDSKTILWNGPLGVFEMENFANGTISLGEYIAESTANGAFSLVGGGDSVAAVKQFGLEPKMSYVSTGGGAMLEMLEGRTLPGIAAILE